MIEDLLVICKYLLKAIEVAEFSTDDELYILSVVRKIIFVLLIELAKK